MLAAQATRRSPEQSIAVHLPPTPLIHCGIESPTSGDVPTPRKVHRETAGNQAPWQRPPADRGQLPLARGAVRDAYPAKLPGCYLSRPARTGLRTESLFAHACYVSTIAA